MVAVDDRGRIIIGSQARDTSRSWTCDSNRDADQRRNPHVSSPTVAYLERYLPNGLLDTSFGDAGVATIPQFAHYQGLRTIGVLDDGSVAVLMEGESPGCLPATRVGRDIALRMDANGEWDRDWAPQGRMLTDLFGVFAMVVNDDRVLLAGDALLHVWQADSWSTGALPQRTTTQSMAMSPRWVAINDVNGEPALQGSPIAPRTANGWLIRNDAGLSQATNPVRFRIPLELPPLHLPGRSLLAWDTQGRMIAVTFVYELASLATEGLPTIEDTYFIVSRLNVGEDGTAQLDPGFGDAGLFVFRPEPLGRPQRHAHPFQVAATPDGGILILGYGPVSDFGYVNFALRLTDRGILDASFGTGGLVPLPNEAIMEGPAAVDGLGRWFGAADGTLVAGSGTRAKASRPAALRMARSGALAVSSGSGWRTITMEPKKPSKLRIVSMAGCQASGPRSVTVVVRVLGWSGARWTPLRGAQVDLTQDDEYGNNQVIVRKATDRRGYVTLEGMVPNSGPLGIYFGLSNTHLETFQERPCGAG